MPTEHGQPPEYFCCPNLSRIDSPATAAVCSLPLKVGGSAAPESPTDIFRYRLAQIFRPRCPHDQPDATTALAIRHARRALFAAFADPHGRGLGQAHAVALGRAEEIVPAVRVELRAG